MAVSEPQWEHPLDVQEQPAQVHLVWHMPQSIRYDLKTHQCIQVWIRLSQPKRGDLSLPLIRKIRANHLGSNLHLGAEAQLIDHAIQTSRQRLILCQGITPSNSKGGLPAPEAGARVEEEGVRDEIDPSPSRSEDLQDKAEPQAVGLTQPPRESRRERTRRPH